MLPHDSDGTSPCGRVLPLHQITKLLQHILDDQSFYTGPTEIYYLTFFAYPVISLARCGSITLQLGVVSSERAMGIEPTSQPWKGCVLPLNDARIYYNNIVYIVYKISAFVGAAPKPLRPHTL